MRKLLLLIVCWIGERGELLLVLEKVGEPRKEDLRFNL
jgi:hypothetical protein